MGARRTVPWYDPRSLEISIGSPSCRCKAAASSSLNRISRRTAPSSGSISPWIIELNCFPRRVLRRNCPSGMSRSGGRTTEKRAFPSGGGKQEDGVRRIDEHRGGEDDVLVDPERHAAQGLADVLRLRQRLEEIASRHVEDVEVPGMGRIDHPDGGHAVCRRRAESPEALE